MFYATLSGPDLFPAITQATLDEACMVAGAGLRLVRVAAQSAALAALLWLVVAAPGALVDHATTTSLAH